MWVKISNHTAVSILHCFEISLDSAINLKLHYSLRHTFWTREEAAIFFIKISEEYLLSPILKFFEYETS